MRAAIGGSTLRGVFERFTDRARRVVVLAQEEARLLSHNYLGTEHILLGLLHEGEGVACRTLQSLGIDLEASRARVGEIIGRGGASPSGHTPFTPRAKKVLEMSLREALQLGDNYIGTEHILLALIREGEGVAAQVLVGLGADLSIVRDRVVSVRTGHSGEAAARACVEERTVRLPARGTGAEIQPVCSFCGRDLWEAARYLQGEGAAICDECITAASSALSSAPSDRHALVMPIRIYGAEPQEGASDAIARGTASSLRRNERQRHERMRGERRRSLRQDRGLAGALAQ